MMGVIICTYSIPILRLIFTSIYIYIYMIYIQFLLSLQDILDHIEPQKYKKKS